MRPSPGLRPLAWALVLCAVVCAIHGVRIGNRALNFVKLAGDIDGNKPDAWNQQGETAPDTLPGSRTGAAHWNYNGTMGRRFYLFGGVGAASLIPQSLLSDMFYYDLAVKQWAYIYGDSYFGYQTGVYGNKGTASTSNWPGCRLAAATWSHGEDLWLFGGWGYDSALGFNYLSTSQPDNPSELNDLWKFNVPTGQWTWVGGSNLVNAPTVLGPYRTFSATSQPGARQALSYFTDPARPTFLFMFGGLALPKATYNQMWVYDISVNQWAWWGGVNGTGIAGIYNGSFPWPGSRDDMGLAEDFGRREVYIFGGKGLDKNGVGDPKVLNDLWRYNLATDTFTFVAGCAIASAACCGDPSFPSCRGFPTMFAGGTLGDDLVLLFGYNQQEIPLLDSWVVTLNRTSAATPIASAFNLVANASFGTIGVASGTNYPPPAYSISTFDDGSHAKFYMQGGLLAVPTGQANPSVTTNAVWTVNFCSYGCANCTDAGLMRPACTDCDPSVSYYPSQDGSQCINVPLGYYISGNTSAACTTGCRACSASGLAYPTQCQTCDLLAGWYVNVDGASCVNACPTGSTADAPTGTCKPDPPPAAILSGSGGAGTFTQPVVIGIAAGGAALLLVVVVLVVCLCRRRGGRDSGGFHDAMSTRKVDLTNESNGARIVALLNAKSTKRIGRGGAAEVFRVKLEDGSMVALKKLTSTNDNEVMEFHSEVNMLSRLAGSDHPNVIQMKFFCNEPPVVALELVDGGNVRTLLSSGMCDEAKARDILSQTASGMKHLHSKDICHNDLKPQNLLIGDNFTIKVTDFGASQLYRDENNKIIKHTVTGNFNGTANYSAPERFQPGAVVDLKKADVYSFGVLGWELFSGRAPFESQTPEQIINSYSSQAPSTIDRLGGMPARMPADLRNLIALCLSVDPRMRPSMAEVCSTLTGETVAYSHQLMDSEGGATSNEAYESVAVNHQAPFFGSQVSNSPSNFNSVATDSTLDSRRPLAPTDSWRAGGGRPGAPPARPPRAGTSGSGSMRTGLDTGLPPPPPSYGDSSSMASNNRTLLESNSSSMPYNSQLRTVAPPPPSKPKR